MADVTHTPGGPEAPDSPENVKTPRVRRKSKRGQPSVRKHKAATIQIRIAQENLDAMHAAKERERYDTLSDWARHHLIYCSMIVDVVEDRLQLDDARARINNLLGYMDRNDGRLSAEYLRELVKEIHKDIDEVIDAMLRRVHP